MFVGQFLFSVSVKISEAVPQPRIFLSVIKFFRLIFRLTGEIHSELVEYVYIDR